MLSPLPRVLREPQVLREEKKHLCDPPTDHREDWTETPGRLVLADVPTHSPHVKASHFQDTLVVRTIGSDNYDLKHKQSSP